MSMAGQQEHYFTSNDTLLALELVKTIWTTSKIAVRTESYQIWVGIWQVRVGRKILLLLDTNVDGIPKRTGTYQ